MFPFRLPVRTLLGVFAVAALLVPPSAIAQGAGVSLRILTLRAAATPPVGGAVTAQELPGCFNPSEPFAGSSKGACTNPLYQDNGMHGENPLYGARGPRQTTSLDGSGSFDPNGGARGPRQTTSLDGSFNPGSGALSLRLARDLRDGAVDGLAIGERGPSLDPTPTYNSALASSTGLMGRGWAFPYSMSVRVLNGVATITQENGSQVVFTKGVDGRFHAPPRVIASFKGNSDGTFTLTRGAVGPTCPSFLLQSCESFTFTNGKISRESTVDGSVTITRDATGRPVYATADSGDSLTFLYASGRIAHIAASGGAGSESFTYDASGNLTSFTDPNGNTTQFTYDAAHRMTSVSDPLGRTTLYQYDSSGRVTGVTDALGHQTTYAYNAAAHTTTVTSPEGRDVVLIYDQNELVDVSVGGTPPLAEWTFAYDPKTLALTRTVDPNLNVTTSAVSTNGLLVRATDALGNTATAAYSDTGRWSTTTDPMGVTTKLTYDEFGNVLTRTTPNTSFGTKQLQTYSWMYDDPAHPGDMTSSVDPLGNVTDFTYDSSGNPASVTDPLGNTTTYSSLFTRCPTWEPPPDMTDPLGHVTTHTCDKNGNLLTTTDATGATTTNTYDADNELTSTTDPVGRTTTYSYDADGRLAAVIQPDGTSSTATYGADGELLTTVDPAGGAQRFHYDPLGRLTSSTDQLGRSTTFAYDAAGNLTSSTDAMGVTASNTYDGDNRLLSTSYSDGATPTVSYAYDPDGRRTSMTDGTGTTTYTYDSLGRTTETQDSFKDVIDSAFNLRDDRTAITYPNGHTVTMQYDGNGQMTAVTDWLGNTTRFQYDGAGNLISSHVLGGKTTTWTYDAARRKVHGVHRGENGIAYASFTYTRAADGAITSVDTTGLGQPTQTYTYDANGRLSSENGNPVSFDSRGNVIALPDGSTLSYDAADELVSTQSGGVVTSYTTNADGERTAATSPTQVTAYEWNAAGDLTSFTSNGTTTTYTTNGDGQRVSSSSGGVTHPFVWDTGSFARGIVTTKPGGSAGGSSAGRLAQPLLAGTLLLSDGTYSFIYGPDGTAIEQIDNADHALFLDSDAQGSVRLLTDAAGNVLGTASYDAFRNQTAQSGAASPFKKFEGLAMEADIAGLVDSSGQVYDPATGQRVKAVEHTVGRIHYDELELVRSGEGCGNGYCKSTEVCGNGYADYTEWAAGPRHYDDVKVRFLMNEARCGDGIDESCQGQDLLCTLSPYAVGGGDPVNASAGRVKITRDFSSTKEFFKW